MKMPEENRPMFEQLRKIGTRAPGCLSGNVKRITARALAGEDINPAQLQLAFEAWSKACPKRTPPTINTEATKTQSHGVAS